MLVYSNYREYKAGGVLTESGGETLNFCSRRVCFR
jgi:hypothetical protein